VVGGKELMMKKNRCGNNSLHTACTKRIVSTDVVLNLLALGGKELAVEKNHDGRNALHIACEEYNAKIDVVSMLIKVGGKEIAMEKDRYGSNPLRIALANNTSYDIVLKLIDVGGKEIIMEKGRHGFNSLHQMCGKIGNDDDLLHDTLDEELLDIIVEHCGAEVLTQTDHQGWTALQYFIARRIHQHHRYWSEKTMKRNYTENAFMLINKGVELQVEGDYGIGGLFSSSFSQDVKDKIYQNWDKIILPALEQVMALPHGRNLPIIQATIVNKAPPRIIKSTVERFAESINIADSSGKYPIDLAVDHGLAWNSGMKELLEGSNVDIIKREDISTGLYPFMVAALGGKENGYDFDSVFHLIKLSARVHQQFGHGDNEGQQHSRKRKRS